MMIKTLLITAIVMLLLDSVYLSIFSEFFNNVVQQVQGSRIKFKLSGAILCYMLLIGGLYYFIISRNKSVKEAFILGIVIYGVYESTTYALLDKWSPQAVLIDTLWGGILFALTTAITYTFYQ
jgi:uncharacterized membrane protein